MLNNLETLRKERGLTQTELARRCSLTQTAISYYESGGREPRPHTVLLLSLVLDCQHEELTAEPKGAAMR